MVPPVNWFDHPHFVVTKKGWKVDYDGIKSGSMCMSDAFSTIKMYAQRAKTLAMVCLFQVAHHVVYKLHIH